MSTTISIITPSYNQGQFIERTINSVLSQDMPDLEYFVVDGGSTDSTVEILKKYTSQLRWVSEKDRGQTDAVNKGIKATSAEIIGWLNSDDIYYPDAFKIVCEMFANNPKIDVIYGDAYHIDVDDKVLESYYTESWNIERLKEVCYLCQPAVFFRRSVIERFGLLNEDLQYCMDYEFWLRLASKGASFAHLSQVLAGSRLHEDTKTLGSRVKVHHEINDMLKVKFKRVPDRWLSNYAHAFVETGFDKNQPAWRLKRAIALRTILSSLRWNKWISKSMLQQSLSWLADSLQEAALGKK